MRIVTQKMLFARSCVLLFLLFLLLLPLLLLLLALAALAAFVVLVVLVVFVAFFGDFSVNCGFACEQRTFVRTGAMDFFKKSSP